MEEKQLFLYELDWTGKKSGIAKKIHLEFSKEWFNPNLYSLGRNPKCTIPIEKKKEIVSWEHAEICVGRHGIKIRDIGSAYGTYVQGEKLKAYSQHSLKEGDRFSLGPLGEGMEFLLKSDTTSQTITRLIQRTSGNQIHWEHVTIQAHHFVVGGGDVNIEKEPDSVFPQKAQLATREIKIDKKIDSNPDYCFLITIAAGGMGIISLAKDCRNGGYVVIKTLINYQDINFLKEEARLLQLVNHPHVVKYRDFTTMKINAYLIMEFINGPSLKEYLQKQPECDIKQQVVWMIQIVDALLYLHNLQISHLDVKPENIIVSGETLQAILIDFGLAHQIGMTISKSKAEQEVRGTLSFISPEMFFLQESSQGLPEKEEKKQRYSIYFSSDGYGLAATFYYLLTRRSPNGENVYRTLNDKNLPPQFTAKDAGDAYLQKICKDQLMFEPNDRPTLDIFKARLQLWLMFSQIEKQKKIAIDWQELADTVLQPKGLILDKLKTEWRKALVEEIRQSPPIFFDGRITDFHELKQEDQLTSTIYWMPNKNESQEANSSLLLEIAPQISWNGFILSKALAIASFGKDWYGISFSISKPKTKESFHDFYTLGFLDEMSGQFMEAKKHYEKAASIVQFGWEEILLEFAFARIEAQIGEKFEKEITICKDIRKELDELLYIWPEMSMSKPDSKKE